MRAISQRYPGGLCCWLGLDPLRHRVRLVVTLAKAIGPEQETRLLGRMGSIVR